MYEISFKLHKIDGKNLQTQMRNGSRKPKHWLIKTLLTW